MPNSDNSSSKNTSPVGSNKTGFFTHYELFEAIGMTLTSIYSFFNS